MSDNPASMIGLCQEGKISPGALRRSAGGNSFLVLRRVVLASPGRRVLLPTPLRRVPFGTAIAIPLIGFAAVN